MELSFKEIVEAINGKVVVRGRENFNNVCIDTRKIQKDNIYIAIKGERFDGNKFVIDAFKKGASIAIVSEILFDID